MPSPTPHPTTRALPDERLVALVRSGQARAFDGIVARYEASLTAYARGVLGGAHHDAEEAVQDAFLRALAALRRRPDQAIVLKPWLHAIVRNACLDRLRRPQRTVDLAALEGLLADPGADPQALLLGRERLAALLGDLGRLPERQRAALVLLEVEGRSHEGIADRLGVSVGASKALVCRARAQMAELRDAA